MAGMSLLGPDAVVFTSGLVNHECVQVKLVVTSMFPDYM